VSANEEKWLKNKIVKILPVDEALAESVITAGCCVLV
jgi:hypothetical protein